MFRSGSKRQHVDVEQKRSEYGPLRNPRLHGMKISLELFPLLLFFGVSRLKLLSRVLALLRLLITPPLLLDPPGLLSSAKGTVTQKDGGETFPS